MFVEFDNVLMEKIKDKTSVIDEVRNKKPNCWNCRYFAISWHPSMPYACQLMGFKSKVLPCLEVEAVDNRPCQGFMVKPSLSRASLVSNPKTDMWLA